LFNTCFPTFATKIKLAWHQTRKKEEKVDEFAFSYLFDFHIFPLLFPWGALV
jgi:hypothetical protein